MDKKIIKQFKELFVYGIFGVLTTIVNIIVYTFFTKELSFHYLIANIVAWIIAVAFAFITNKIFVFNSKSWKSNVWVKGLAKFVGARLVTGILDMIMMYVMVDLLILNDVFSKVVVNIIVILTNFVFSKLFIFKKNQ